MKLFPGPRTKRRGEGQRSIPYLKNSGRVTDQKSLNKNLASDASKPTYGGKSPADLTLLQYTGSAIRGG